MKFIRTLLLLCTLSATMPGLCHPNRYRYNPRPATTSYYHSKYCDCYQCYASYYNCPYCYDSYNGCSECDSAMGKFLLIASIIGIAAYLVDRVTHS